MKSLKTLETHTLGIHSVEVELWMCPFKCKKDYLNCSNLNRHLCCDLHCIKVPQKCKIDDCGVQTDCKEAL